MKCIRCIEEDTKLRPNRYLYEIVERAKDVATIHKGEALCTTHLSEVILEGKYNQIPGVKA